MFVFNRALKVRSERLCAPPARNLNFSSVQTFHVWLPSFRRYRGDDSSLATCHLSLARGETPGSMFVFNRAHWRCAQNVCAPPARNFHFPFNPDVTRLANFFSPLPRRLQHSVLM